MHETPLEYFAEPGKSIEDACRESLRIANTNGLPVWFNFNGTRVEVTPGMRETDAVDQYFSKRNQPTETMNETESLRARIASLEAEITSIHKRRAAIEAMDAYKTHATTHAQEIADEAAAMFARNKLHPITFPRTAEFLALRREADRKREEAFA